jgi:hypothetical protein
MNANASTIWSVPAYLPYLQPELTDDRIRDAESHIGFSLPAEYLSLLHSQNGGYIRFHLPDLPHHQIYGIGPRFRSITDVDWDDAKEYVTVQLDGLVPFDGDGHWHLRLDYRNGRSSPCITYVDVECDSESKIAITFSNYLRLLKFDVGENDFFIPSVSDVEDVKTVVGRLLGIAFEEPDSWAHGYPVHRARVSNFDDPEWIWISPNLVPRGFVRDDDRGYDELRQMMHGQAKRYPNLPEKSFIVTFTDGARPAILAAFRAASIELRAIKDMLGK